MGTTTPLARLLAVRSWLGEEVEGFLRESARRLWAKPNAWPGGKVADEGLDLWLRLTPAAASGGPGTMAGAGGWLGELAEGLRREFAPPARRAERTCAAWFREEQGPGVFVLLGAGGAGKSWSTARALADLAAGLADGLRDRRLDLNGHWRLPLWVHAPALAARLRKVPVIKSQDDLRAFVLAEARGEGCADDHGGGPPEEGPGPRLHGFLQHKLRRGEFLVVVDAVNELKEGDEVGRQRFRNLCAWLATASRAVDNKGLGGRAVFCCRPDAWEAQGSLAKDSMGWLPSLVFDEAVRGELLDLPDLRHLPDGTLHELVARQRRALAGGATDAGGRPSAAVGDWPAVFRNQPALREACRSPLMLALTLGVDAVPVDPRRVRPAHILQGAFEALLRGRWKENSSPVFSDPELCFPPGLRSEVEGKIDAAKTLLCLTAWHLYSRRRNANAFRAAEWETAFAAAVGDLRSLGRTSIVEAIGERPGTQAGQWERACRELGLLVKVDAASLGFLHELFFDYLAACGLALQPDGRRPWLRAMVGGGRFRFCDPWVRAFRVHGMRHGRVSPAALKLFTFLPTATALVHLPAPAVDERLEGLLREVRTAVAVDLSGTSVLLRLALACGGPAGAGAERVQAVMDALQRFPLDRELTRELAGNDSAAGADFGWDAETDEPRLEAEVRGWLHLLPVNPALHRVAQTRVERLCRSWPLRRLKSDKLLRELPRVCSWLVAMESPKKSRDLISKMLRKRVLRLTLPDRVKILRTLHAIAQAAPEVVTPDKVKEEAQRVYEDSVRVLTLPHVWSARPRWQADAACLHALSRGNFQSPEGVNGGRSKGEPLWCDPWLASKWAAATVSPPPGAASNQPWHVRLFGRLLASAARQRANFLLWFWCAYFFRTPIPQDQAKVRFMARHLLRKHLPLEQYYLMLVPAMAMLASRSIGPSSHSTLLEQDAGQLPPPPSWRVLSWLAFWGLKAWVWSWRVLLPTGVLYYFWSLTRR